MCIHFAQVFVFGANRGLSWEVSTSHLISLHTATQTVIKNVLCIHVQGYSHHLDSDPCRQTQSLLDVNEVLDSMYKWDGGTGGPRCLFSTRQMDIFMVNETLSFELNANVGMLTWWHLGGGSVYPAHHHRHPVSMPTFYDLLIIITKHKERLFFYLMMGDCNHPRLSL